MISAFKNESGSTTLTVVVAIAVAVCLLSVSIQWYWVNSSASDVQLAADLGAMAEQEAIGRAVLIMQIIDVTILSANFLGLLLHALVVVGGIAAVAQAPLGGGVGSALLPRLVEIDKNYVERRKQFVDMLYSAATKLNKVTPALAFGYARKLVDENNSFRAKFNQAQYGVIPVPFPLEGSVQRASRYTQDAEMLDDVTRANQQNQECAEEIKELTEKVEELKAQCFSLDDYKDESTMPSTWKTEEAVSDFSSAFQDIVQKAGNEQNDLIPIDSTSSGAQTRINEAFLKNEQDVQNHVTSVFSAAFGTGANLNVSLVSSDNLFKNYLEQEVYLIPHDAGERKAYHSDPECTGLANAQSAPEKVALQSVYGQSDHPPCSICLPFSWRAVSVWQENLDSFISRWNREAEALIAYDAARRELKQKQDELQADVSASFDALLAEAQAMLASDRLVYRPPGRRGVLCIGYLQKQGAQPSFTLSRLTHTSNEKPGTQYAVSAARLKPLCQSGYVSNIIQSQRSDYSETNARFGSGVFAFLDGDTGLFTSLSSLWYGVTNFYLKGTSGLESMFDNLPWGIGAIAKNFMNQLQKTAGVSKPDLRTYRPFLVNTSEIGDANAPGIEGQYVSQTKASKQLFNTGAKLSESSVATFARASLNSLGDTSFSGIFAQMSYSIFSATFSAPFTMSLASFSSSTVPLAKQSLSALGW